MSKCVYFRKVDNDKKGFASILFGQFSINFSINYSLIN